MTENTIRAGEADIVINCSLAAQPPEIDIDTSGPEADLGRAVHDALEAWIKAGTGTEPQPQPFANQHNVDVDKVAELIAFAPAALQQIREDLSGLRAEVVIKGGGVRGRIDGLAVEVSPAGPFSAAILDWKTGRDPQENSKPLQRLAYASAVEATYGMPAQCYIYTAEIWLAAQEIISSRYDIDSIQGFRRKLAEQLAHPKASPGSHCKYCRRRFDCRERDQYLRSAALGLTIVGTEIQTTEALASLWDQSRALKKALEAYEKAVDLVVEENGNLDLGDGRRIIHGTKTLDDIDPRKAWPVMQAAGLTNDDLNAVVKIGKTRLLNAIGAKAPRGSKAAAKAEMVTRLDEAGAISRKTSRFRKVVSE
jgi:hypothetical protein